MNAFDFVILGGGVAGLCAARHLLELGYKPLVVEVGSYPRNKVCGEFLSPSSLPLLKKWDISTTLIHQLSFHSSLKQCHFTLKAPAGSLSHYTLDTLLANQISQLGGTVLTQVKVEQLTPALDEHKSHLVHLSTGEKIQAKYLFLSNGIAPNLKKPLNARYMGFKAHFEGVNLDSTLAMFFFPGAYLGIVPVEKGWLNIACLATTELVKQASSTHEFMNLIIHKNEELRRLLAGGRMLFDNWMVAPIPEFGFRPVPNWTRTFWLGDAAATIPPASGNGLSMALISGCMAAEFALRDDATGFKNFWKKRNRKQILMGKALHRLFLSEKWTPLLNRSWMSSVARNFFTWTRDPGIQC